MPVTTLEKLIQYFYTSKFADLNFRDCGWILTCSDYYLLQDEIELLQFCKKEINSPLTNRNYFEAMQLSMEINNQELTEKAISVIPSMVFDTQHLVGFCVKILQENHKIVSELNETRLRLKDVELRLSKIEEMLYKN